MNPDNKSLEAVFLIAICCQSGNKMQSKTVLTIFDLPLSIVLTFSIAPYPVCLLRYTEYAAKTIWNKG